MSEPAGPTEVLEQPADRLLSTSQAMVAAIGLAALVVAQLRLTADEDRAFAAALTCQTVVAIYVGFALVRGRMGELAVEVVFFLVATNAIFLGREGAEGWLAAVLFAHGGWDLLHHRREDRPRLGVRNVPRWYPPACLAFDWPVAVAILLLVP